MNKLVFVVTLVSVLSAHSGAQETHWTLDKAHSQVKFTVQHLVISELTGRFKEFDATFKTIGDDIGTASVEAVIKTASIDTDNERRDTHLRSDDFLNVEKFPEMKFKSTSVENAGNNTYRIKGDLTIRDITRPVVLDTKYSGFVKTPWGGEVGAFKASV
ncbi:MAG: YceI family protein, partial [Bacteroidota bacterium]